MGRGPVWEWLLARPFLPEACAPGNVSGISGPFEPLSRSPRWVTHVLLTRPPLTVRVSPNGSLDLHVLGTPPAFALSQDQTLQFDFEHITAQSSALRPRTGQGHAHHIGEPVAYSAFKERGQLGQERRPVMRDQPGGCLNRRLNRRRPRQRRMLRARTLPVKGFSRTPVPRAPGPPGAARNPGAPAG
jgi:hypothetical protein